MEVKHVSSHIILIVLVILFSNVCKGQFQKSLHVDITADTLIKVGFVEKKSQFVKVYSEDLIKKMKGYRKESVVLPEGFSDHYLYEVIETMKCKKEEYHLLPSSEINRKKLLKLSREKIDTIAFYRENKGTIVLMLSILKIEE